MAEDTSTMFANMLGLGPLLQTAQDPQFLATVKAVLDAIADTRARCERMENRLARIEHLLKLVTDGNDTPAASLRAELGTAGAGACTAPGRLAHDGAGDAAATAGPSRSDAGSTGVGTGGGT